MRIDYNTIYVQKGINHMINSDDELNIGYILEDIFSFHTMN